MFRFLGTLLGGPLREAAEGAIAWAIFFALWGVASGGAFLVAGLPYWLANGGEVGKYLWAAVIGSALFGIAAAGTFIDSLVKGQRPAVSRVRGKDLDNKITGE